MTISAPVLSMIYLRFFTHSGSKSKPYSSTWKDDMSYKEILDMWKYRGLPGFVTDVTPTTAQHNRGDEIDAWLKECPTECNYIIIDDLEAYNFNEHQIPRFLIVNPLFGLDEYTAERAIRILNGL